MDIYSSIGVGGSNLTGKAVTHTHTACSKSSLIFSGIAHSVHFFVSQHAFAYIVAPAVH